MTIWEKSLLLHQLRFRLEEDRTTDWQSLHRRDRGWYLEQNSDEPWTLLQNWLAGEQRQPQAGIGLLIYGLSLLALITGFSLMAGLLEFLTFERINLLWFLLIAILLPLAWWALALLFTSAQVPLPLQGLVKRHIPQGGYLTTLHPLLKLTVIALGQQLSLLFAVGLVGGFLLYLLITDLAFGWSSTLDLTAGMIHRLGTGLAWPWQQLWPAAVPSLTLVEATHYFRSAPGTVTDPELYGQWWRFLLMCLFCYVLLPRLATTLLSRVRLNRLLQNIRREDALISGLWERMSSEFIDNQCEQVEQLGMAPDATSSALPRVSYPQVIAWGIWPAEVLTPLERQLKTDSSGVSYWQATGQEALPPLLEQLAAGDDQPLLLLCKGWEPPTGELADLCVRIGELRTRAYLQPAPLPGMGIERQATLTQSWLAFMRQIPENFHLISGESE